jgi:hypothetical protein
MEEKILYPKSGYEIQSYAREKFVIDVDLTSFSRSSTQMGNERNQRYKHMAMKSQRLPSQYIGESAVYTPVWVDNILLDPRLSSKEDEKMSQADRKDSLSDADDEKKSFSKSYSKSSKGDK